MTRAWLLLIASLAFAGAPVAAAAPKRPPLARTLRGEALAAYETARQDFKAQRFAQALAGFVRAHAVSREPRLLWNQAACLRKLERNAEALRAIDTYLAEGAAELSSEELEEGRAAQSAVRLLVARVRIATVPPGAAVFVDGTPVDPGSPEGLYLEPGRHAFLFQKEGFADRVRQEALRANEEVSWTVELAPNPAVAAPAPAPAASAVLAPPPTVVKRPWAPWLLVGGGAAAAGVGGLLLGLSSAEYARLEAECGTMCSPQRVAPARAEETAGVVLLAAGGAVAAAGLGWWLFSGTTVQAQVSPAPGGLAVGGRF